MQMENRIGAPRSNRPSIARKTNFRPSYEFSHPSRPPIFQLSASVPFRHLRRSCLIDRPETWATSRGETDSEITGGALEGLRNSIPPQSCSILFVNDRIKEERRFNLLTGPLFNQNRHSYFTSVIYKASTRCPRLAG